MTSLTDITVLTAAGDPLSYRQMQGRKPRFCTGSLEISPQPASASTSTKRSEAGFGRYAAIFGAHRAGSVLHSRQQYRGTARVHQEDADASARLRAGEETDE
jgi:hypothetical protein